MLIFQLPNTMYRILNAVFPKQNNDPYVLGLNSGISTNNKSLNPLLTTFYS